MENEEKLFGNAKNLKKHVKESQLPYKKAVIDYYKSLGETHGFTTLTNTQEIVNSVDYGKLELVWVEPDIVFQSEFGIIEDIYKHLFKIQVLKPKSAVLLLSSKSRCHPEKAKEIIEKTPELADIKFEIIDVA